MMRACYIFISHFFHECFIFCPYLSSLFSQSLVIMPNYVSLWNIFIKYIKLHEISIPRMQMF